MRSLLPLLHLFLMKGAGASDPNLPFMDYLDQNHLVCLKWGFDNPQGNITLKFIVNTTGWVGFGFSPNGGMAGSDILMGGVGPNGSYFSDRHATGNSMPVVDEKQSYTLVNLYESEGQTIMTLERSIQACDDKDFDITAQPIKVIYAYGMTDNMAYHGSLRGVKELNLLNYSPRTAITNTNYLSATVDNITIPARSTYYHCKVMKFPNLHADTTYHVYQIEPVIQNIDLVHHMLLYRCPSYVTVPYDKPCYMGDMGDACFTVVAAWGVGGGVFELPENTGFPFGGAHSNMFYRLEIHYDNPKNESGRTDSSGLRLHYTAQLRKYDVGILTTGVSPGYLNYKIPPRAAQFRSYGVCNTTLFSQILNTVPDLQVFAVMLHTHLAGRKVRVALHRNEKQIDFVALEENFNFELQQGVILGSVKTIKPGDEIVVECTYSTTDRTKATQMGLATTDEMCLAFLLYYPAISISTCTSFPNTSDSTQASDQDDIAMQETFLKTVPQIQSVTDDNLNYGYNIKGMVREMMATPTINCPTNNAGRRLCISWIMNPAGIILLLLWIAIM